MFKSLIKPHLFCYATVPQTIATGNTANPAINIANDAQFEILEIRAAIHKAESFTGAVNMLLQTSSGDLFSNVALDLLAFASVEQDSWSGYPIKLPFPIVLPQNTTLQVQLTNTGGESVTVQIQFWGVKSAVPGERVQ
jgi:hypothetical protein